MGQLSQYATFEQVGRPQLTVVSELAMAAIGIFGMMAVAFVDVVVR